jgi:DNA polymerase I-like protein with 3'-5' exonuclease and polymerase domains
MKIQFIGTEEDKPFLYNLTNALGSHSNISCSLRKFELLSEISTLYKSKGVTHIITTQEWLIPRVFPTANKVSQKLSDYAGSYKYVEQYDLWILFIPPLRQCVTVAYGSFLLERYISKITKPNNWLPTIPFTYSLLETTHDFQHALDTIQRATFCSVDIETRTDLTISSVSYSCVIMVGRTISIQTFVIPLPANEEVQYYEFSYSWITKFNASETPKLFQNGKYDCMYFQRFRTPVTNYCYDTRVAHHCWFAELPQGLGFLSPFYIKEAWYWKDEAATGNLSDLYRYNALDTWGTAMAFLQWIMEAPQWAKDNYIMEFAVIHPDFLMESTGLTINMNTFMTVKEREEKRKLTALLSARRLVGNCLFNPNSPVQCKNVIKILGNKTAKSADAKVLARMAYAHPLNAVIIKAITEYRKASKLVGTYLNENKLFNKRMLYSLSPLTATGRHQSGEHSFWCGANIQNIPRDGDIRRYMEADEGFVLCELDYSKAESWDTGYITGDINLIKNVNSDRDFHKLNASMFFGLPYEEISKALRQLAKPINHGANYLMSWNTLIDSMGIDKVFMAAKLLNLPKRWTAKDITVHLLSLFANAYPTVANDYPEWIKQEVARTHKLVNPYGYVRYCFGNPAKNPEDLRAYVAHLPQSTNGQCLNIAVALIFNRVWKKYGQKIFKMSAQVHDSSLNQVKIGYEYIADEVKACKLEASTVTVTDIKGIARTMTVPVDVSIGAKSWQDAKE